MCCQELSDALSGLLLGCQELSDALSRLLLCCQELSDALSRLLSVDSSSDRLRSDGKQLVNAINSVMRRERVSGLEEMRAVLQDRDNAVLQVRGDACLF